MERSVSSRSRVQVFDHLEDAANFVGLSTECWPI
jgi:hypothetical protein